MTKLKIEFMKKIVCVMFAAVICVAAIFSGFVTISSEAAGEDATITVTLDRNSLNVGDTFNVKVSYQSNIESAYLTWELTYDNSLVGRDGSSGKIIETEWFDDQNANTKNVTKSYSFKAKAVGKANFSITATSYKLNPDENGDEMSILKIGASATIKDVGSSDATLKELTVDGGSLVPAFSPNTLSYTVTVPFDVTALYVFPTTNDSRATHTIDGDEFLSVGTKTRTVVVTAQDGTVKKYVITITRLPKATAKPTETPSATDKPGQSATVAPVTPTPTVTVTPEFDGTVIIDDVKYSVETLPENVTLPEGFESVKVEYKGKEYTGGKGISKDITLLYLESESYKGLFIYFENDDDFLKYVDINVKSGIYSLMKLTDGTVGLDYKKTTIMIGEESVEAYEIDPDNKDFYIIRAMNWNGEIGYYTYDTVEKTMQRYSELKVSGSEDVKPSATPDASSDDSDMNDEMSPKAQKILIILVVIACVICILVSVFLIYFALKERKTCKIMTSEDVDETDEQ